MSKPTTASPDRLTAAQYRQMPRARRSKYGNVKVTLDGYVFDSKAEARRYKELKTLVAANEIYDLIVNKVYNFSYLGGDGCRRHGFDYIADFYYRDCNGQIMVEDVKGVRTAEYKLKKKLIEGFHGITITEIDAYPTRSKRRVKPEESRHARIHVVASRARQCRAAADRPS